MKQLYNSMREIVKSRGKWFFMCLITVGMAGCAALRTPCPCDAPERLLIDGKEISINAEVSRHQTGGVGALSIQVELSTADKSSFPSTIAVGSYLIRPSDLSHDAYEGSFEQRTPDPEGGVWLLETALGPDWKQGELIDVAVQLTDSKKRILFLKKDKIVIK